MNRNDRYKLNFIRRCSVAFLVILFYGCKQTTLPEQHREADPIPYLRKQGKTTQLIVEGKPFIVLGGELGNSTFTSLESMEPVWPKLNALNLNTVLAPVYWELIEPVQGKFDFDLLDQLMGEARKHNLKLILLWFGSWKNSMSSHVPAWVKTDFITYPRAKDKAGISQEIVTPFSENNLNADRKAFQALMTHLRQTDSLHRTVIMIQPENEIGMLPTAREYSPMANALFDAPVPEEFIQYLTENKSRLVPEFYALWEAHGLKTAGNWEDLFGIGTHTDEIFMAWYFSKYTNEIVKAGKEIYPLPMFVNAALNRPGKEPGSGYPSAGPLPHLMDVWKAAGSSIDFLSPDFYNPDITHWCDLYTRQGNPLFIPEHRFDNTVAAKAFYTIGHYESMGFSTFSIESYEKPGAEDLGNAYALIKELTPLLTTHHGQEKVEGVILDKERQESLLTFGDYEFSVKHSHTLGYEASSANEVWEPAGAMIIQTHEHEFYIAGSGIVITFTSKKNPAHRVGILKNEEGHFDNGSWKVYRHLNGDQTHQGRHIRIFLGDYAIQRVTLYPYQ